MMWDQGCMYAGAAAFALHMIANRFRFSKSTPIFFVVPYMAALVGQQVGYVWVDWKVQSEGLYEAYGIYE